MDRNRWFPALLIVVTAAMFAVATFASGAYRAKRAQLAGQWFARGEQALTSGDPQSAVADFRTALAYSRGDRQYSLRLVQALLAAGRREEARAHLLTLAQDQPADAMINLELARIEAVEGNVALAIQHYHNAIYGVWEQDAEQHRMATRLELARYLLQHGDKDSARAELNAATADMPRDPAVHTRVGFMLFQTGDNAAALQQFRAALELDRRLPDALAGAGRAAYLLGDFSAAHSYLRRAVQLAPGDTASAELLRLTELVLENDPYQPRLSFAERLARVRRDLQYALDRLQACARQRGVIVGKSAPSSDLQALYLRASGIRLTASALARDPDLLDNAMSAFLSIESATAACGPNQDLDRALRLIAQSHREVQP